MPAMEINRTYVHAAVERNAKKNNINEECNKFTKYNIQAFG